MDVLKNFLKLPCIRALLTLASSVTSHSCAYDDSVTLDKVCKNICLILFLLVCSIYHLDDFFHVWFLYALSYVHFLVLNCVLNEQMFNSASVSCCDDFCCNFSHAKQ